MSSPVELFTELFRGNTSAHGVHIPEKTATEGEKAKGQSFTKTEPVTPELYQRHCEGTYSLGIIPIDQNNNVRFMAIDVDIYPLDPKRFCLLIDRYKLPLTCFRSKSGGLHAYCFFSADASATKALDYLHMLRHLLRIPADAETFPKQRRLTAKQKGNWINLPYQGGNETVRYAYGPEGQKLGFEEAMNWCYNRRTTLKGLENCVNSLPFAPAPPCIQAIFMNNEASVNNRNRNIFLFNAAAYLKSRYKDEFADKLALVNDELDKPIDISELETTVIASHTKGSYTYQCEDPLMHDHCYKELCKLREYGKGSGAVSNFSFESLTQVKSMPPYYKWRVNGIEMVFFSETELRNQERFMDYCMRHLHRLPNKLKGDVWGEILNSALQEMIVEEVSADEDFSTNSVWFSYLVEYLTERKIAQRPSQIMMGQVYAASGTYFFRVEDFYLYLTEVKKFRQFTITEIHYNLKRLGFRPTKVYDPALKKSIRAWCGEDNMLSQDVKELEASAEQVKEERQQAHKEAKDTKPINKAVGKKSTDRLRELAEQIPDMVEPIDFSFLKDKEKF